MDVNQQNERAPQQPELPLKSWAERNGFAHWALALFWIVIAFFLFQISAGAVAFTLYVLQEGISGQPDPQQMMEGFMQRLDLLFVGNSFGQIVFLGMATWLFCKLHTSKKGRPSFMRFKSHKSTPRMLLMAIGLIVAAQPVVWFLSWVNIQMPVPESFQNMQNTQMQMIEDFLKGDHNMLLTLFHIGLVPAVCEEVLYRGYTLRAFEKSWGIWTAIIASGLLFGLYHVQLTNLLPLAFIGMLLGFMTYVADSIYPAMLAHLVNNGGSVVLASYYPDSSIAEMTPESMPPLWALVVGTGITIWILSAMYQNREQEPNSSKEDASHVF